MDHLDSLTEREVEVLSAMPGGESNTDLAEYLGITERTVKFHVTNMREKLGGLSRAQLHLLALLTEAVWLCQTCRQKVPEKVLGGAPAVATELRVPAQRAPGSLLLAG
ncbi:helix-turn-helix transcriptional regulator [Streptomyces sp. NPDC048718]|uniref:helix-turn-helix domain-containing protein n=1 Tax=Streptomyces sp. NPDC048718 TaxID=3365587 RepID=UPI00371F1DF7